MQSWFGQKYNEVEPKYTKLFDTVSSSKAFEEDVQSTSFGLAPVKAQGAAVQYDSNQQGFLKRYNHLAYALGYIVTREELADNQYSEVSMKRAASLAWSMRHTKETVCAQVYNRADESAFSGADGKELLATDHTNSTGGTYSNELTTAADLSEASLEDICVQIMNATNDRGLKIALQPTRLIVAPANVFNAQRILKSTLQNDTANNAINALRSLGSIPEFVSSPYLTDTDQWFVRTDCPDGMKFVQREAVEFSRDNDFDTDNAKAKAYERYSVGWTDPRGVYGSPGA